MEINYPSESHPVTWRCTSRMRELHSRSPFRILHANKSLHY